MKKSLENYIENMRQLSCSIEIRYDSVVWSTNRHVKV